MDLTTEAIENDLQEAERNVPRGQIALVRAQIRATLMARTLPEPEGRPAFLALPKEDGTADIQIAVGPFGDSYAVPRAASWDDRVEAAARMLAVERDVLISMFARAGFEIDPHAVPEKPLEAPSEPEDDFEDGLDHPADDVTLDDLEREDSIDGDFFDEARKARKS